MAWVLKMDEVIESGLVHDFDASLSGIGQELGAGAYSMRYWAPWVRRVEASDLLGKAFARRGCDQLGPGLPCRVAVGTMKPSRPLPTPVADVGGQPLNLLLGNRA